MCRTGLHENHPAISQGEIWLLSERFPNHPLDPISVMGLADPSWNRNSQLAEFGSGNLLNKNPKGAGLKFFSEGENVFEISRRQNSSFFGKRLRLHDAKKGAEKFLRDETRFYFFETFTVRRLLPLARRRFKTFLPALLAILSRKPCLRLVLILLGWKVLFISQISIWFHRSPKFFNRGIEKTFLSGVCQRENTEFFTPEKFLTKKPLQFFPGLLLIQTSL